MSDKDSPPLSSLDRRFVRRLKAFATNGHAFGTSGQALKPGTQHEAFDGYLQGIKDGHRHGYFDIPTGVGKTAVFTSLIENYLDAANGHKDGKRVLVVVPNITLVKQTANAFAKFMPEIAPKLEADDDSGHPIDWDKGQIGVQYRALKHADKKPRVLITTYASLRRDKENQVYDPKEFGLVVYDEGHSITADESGKAVEKFKDAIQLAVTATPDYDDDEKRVGAKLAHCYYRLPLADAINRRDLCGVRPILIKTDFTVDTAKVEEYIKTNNGNRLSDAQLQTLFNVESRNRSVIETYLADRDPDSGERYLGQNGLIFSGGITHANDLVDQFNKALGEPRFAKIQRWLADEHLEIAAAVHSRTKGAWLRPGLMIGFDESPLPDRKREGNREWYSEDEVRKLHEEGKILLLISDKKLREGYDCPKDSIIIDMVDRLSVVDVTQRFGRGFRLDPNDPDKVCTPINLVDANTHDIYKDRPQMLPIYASEILDGAEFRKPMKRKLTRKFNHEIPEADKALDHGQFEVISNPEVVRQHNNKERRPMKAPFAKSGWISGRAIMDKHGGTHPIHTANILALGEEKRAELIAEGMDEVRARKEVKDKWVEWAAGKGGSPAWNISPEGLEELINAGKVPKERLPKAKPSWTSGNAIMKDRGGTSTVYTANIQALGKEKWAELIAAGMNEAQARREVEKKWVEWAASKSGPPAWHVSPEGLEELIIAGKVPKERLPKAKPGWTLGNAIRQEYGGMRATHDANIQHLGQEKRAELIAGGMSKARAFKEVADKWVEWAASKQGKGAWHVSPAGLQELIRSGKVCTDRQRRNQGAGDANEEAPGVEAVGDGGQSWAEHTGRRNPEPMKRTGRARGKTVD